MKKVIFCIPTTKKPYQVTLDSLEASIPLIQADGWDEGLVSEVGCPYISHARTTMLRKALDAKADVIVFIDHDLSWDAEDLLTLINSEGDVVAGTYRFKYEPEKYMGLCLPYPDGSPQVRADGGVRAYCAPAGFLKITKECVNKFIDAYPELCFGDRYAPSVDLFNHGAFEGVWYGEDYAFCRRWRDTGGDIVIVPDLNINHWNGDIEYKGNYHHYLQSQPGGSESLHVAG
jgi:glycosyltransferase involved in cell wall biosynthesis